MHHDTTTTPHTARPPVHSTCSHCHLASWCPPTTTTAAAAPSSLSGAASRLSLSATPHIFCTCTKPVRDPTTFRIYTATAAAWSIPPAASRSSTSTPAPPASTQWRWRACSSSAALVAETVRRGHTVVYRYSVAAVCNPQFVDPREQSRDGSGIWTARASSPLHPFVEIVHVVGLSVPYFSWAPPLPPCADSRSTWLGSKAAADPHAYLRGCVWLLQMYLTGECPDYRWVGTWVRGWVRGWVGMCVGGWTAALVGAAVGVGAAVCATVRPCSRTSKGQGRICSPAGPHWPQVLLHDCY